MMNIGSVTYTYRYVCTYVCFKRINQIGSLELLQNEYYCNDLGSNNLCEREKWNGAKCRYCIFLSRQSVSMLKSCNCVCLNGGAKLHAFDAFYIVKNNSSPNVLFFFFPFPFSLLEKA